MSALTWTPLLPMAVIIALGLMGLATGLLALVQQARGGALRLGAAIILTLMLLNPSIVREERQSQKDVAVVVADISPSQSLGVRPAQSMAALDHLKEEIGKLENVELKIIESGTAGDYNGTVGDHSGTALFRALADGLADTPATRVAGVVMITDGQVHDIPQGGLPNLGGAPLHVLLTGESSEKDRRLTIEKAPRYGIVGQDVTIAVRLSPAQNQGGKEGPVRLIVRRDNERPFTWTVWPGKTSTRKFRIQHGGSNLFEFEAARIEGELTGVNNRALAIVNGVRDRLKVLLISGEPYAGERVWRNFLKSDPSVDLVHFTILRPPEKQDMTPVNELALIAFPIRELFEEKLGDFDLIIFDHYKRRGLLPWAYFRNIVTYVRQGGAVLDSVGPDFATPLSLFRTPLGDLLPGAPTGDVIKTGFRPAVTGLGKRHPVTADLRGAGQDNDSTDNSTDNPTWGRWFRQIDASARRGNVLMDGVADKPLLILDRVADGRVAQILSDHIWLWARGFEGGGPQGELLRRLAHWLMKEPELEENSLSARGTGSDLVITRRSLKGEGGGQATVTPPSGQTQQVDLQPLGKGKFQARLNVVEPGLYRISHDGAQTVTAIGALNPLEFSDVGATPEFLGPIAEKTGGNILEIATTPLPRIRQVATGNAMETAMRGKDWIGLRRTGSHRVTGIAETPLIPAILLLALLLCALVLAWKREGA